MIWILGFVGLIGLGLAVALYRAHKRGKEDSAERYWAQFKRYFKQWWRQEPHLIVGEPDNPYMLRWWIIPRNPLLNIYLHKFLRDDDDRALHDHPWPSFSILLSGRLREIVKNPQPCCMFNLTQMTYPNGQIGPHACYSTWELRPPAPVYRSAEHTHRLELPEGKPAWTLFITGPWQRDWGFHCPKGWIPWRKFIVGGVDPSTDGKPNVGGGCPE